MSEDESGYRAYIDKLVSEIYKKILRSGESAIVEIIGIEDFNRFVSTGSSVIVFYNSKCPVCRRFMPIYEEYVAIRKNMDSNIKFGKINTVQKENVIISIVYEVFAVPTITLFRDGKLIARHEGFLDRDELEDFISREFNKNL